MDMHVFNLIEFGSWVSLTPFCEVVYIGEVMYAAEPSKVRLVHSNKDMCFVSETLAGTW